MLPVAARYRPEVDSDPTSDVEEQAELAASVSGVTQEPGSSRLADDVVTELRAAAAKRETAVDEASEPATKRRLETLLQLETHARRTVEENFRRVKGFGFVFLFFIFRYKSTLSKGRL